MAIKVIVFKKYELIFIQLAFALVTPIKILIAVILTLSLSCCSFTPNVDVEKVSEEKKSLIEELWGELQLEGIMSYDLFNMAMVGYYCLEPKNNKKITIIDYTKPSTKERFYVIDLNRKKLLYNCLVAHGKNTGEDYAKYFSNVPESKKSSLGFFITSETYNGKHGYSIRLDGIEKGINDNARRRAIVIHSADYVSYEFISKHGQLGRSWGCPALPKEFLKGIIDSISGGSCMFIYGDDKDYFTNSKYIKKNTTKASKNSKSITG